MTVYLFQSGRSLQRYETCLITCDFSFDTVIFERDNSLAKVETQKKVAHEKKHL